LDGKYLCHNVPTRRCVKKKKSSNILTSINQKEKTYTCLFKLQKEKEERIEKDHNSSEKKEEISASKFTFGGL
jgi:hypothetical protein